VGSQPLDELGRPEPRVHPQGQLAAGAGPAQAGHQLVNEAEDAAGGVGRALAQPGMQHLAAVGAGGQQRMVAESVGVAVAGALLVVAMHLADGGVHIHHQRPIAGSGARRPRPGEELAGHLVELADVPEGKRAQEGPNRRWGHDLVAEHAVGGSRAQQLHIIDAVPARHQRVHQRQQLAPWVGPTRPVTKIHHLVGDLLDLQPLGQRRRQQQPGTGDGTLVIEGDVDLVQQHVRGWHRKGVLRLGDRDRLAAVILPGQGTPFTISPSPPHLRLGGSRLSRTDNQVRKDDVGLGLRQVDLRPGTDQGQQSVSGSGVSQ